MPSDSLLDAVNGTPIPTAVEGRIIEAWSVLDVSRTARDEAPSETQIPSDSTQKPFQILHERTQSQAHDGQARPVMSPGLTEVSVEASCLVCMASAYRML